MSSLHRLLLEPGVGGRGRHDSRQRAEGRVGRRSGRQGGHHLQEVPGRTSHGGWIGQTGPHARRECLPECRFTGFFVAPQRGRAVKPVERGRRLPVEQERRDGVPDILRRSLDRGVSDQLRNRGPQSFLHSVQEVGGIACRVVKRVARVGKCCGGGQKRKERVRVGR